MPPRFDFVVELAELIAVPAIVARLRAPEKTDKVLGRKKNVWCEFHQAYGHITSFQQFSKLFMEQYIVNRAPPVVSYDLFDVRQNQGESLKDYLSRFGAQVVRLSSKDEDMLVHALRKGFCQALSVNR